MAASLDCDDLESEFESNLTNKKKTWRNDPLVKTFPKSQTANQLPSKSFFVEERDKEEWKIRRYHLLSLDAYSRHKLLVNHYLLSQGKGIEHFSRDTSNDKNDYDLLQEEHKFLWSSSDNFDTWGKQLAKAYYDKLFKEYAIADLSEYNKRKIGFRWRTEQEVVVGKGQFVCGHKSCMEGEGLCSWEVNFKYKEQEEQKSALVKVRLCDKCSRKLNQCHKYKRVKRTKSLPSKAKRRKLDSSKKAVAESSDEEGGSADKKEIFHFATYFKELLM